MFSRISSSSQALGGKAVSLGARGSEWLVDIDRRQKVILKALGNRMAVVLRSGDEGMM